MSGSFEVRSPLSFVDTFRALYEAPKKIEDWNHPTPGLAPFNNVVAMLLFFKYCPTGVCGLVRGKPIEVDFRTFPLLNVSKYNETHGKDAAQKAMQEYQTRVEKPSDPSLLPHCGPCAFAAPEQTKSIPPFHLMDVQRLLRLCAKQTQKSDSGGYA